MSDIIIFLILTALYWAVVLTHILLIERKQNTMRKYTIKNCLKRVRLNADGINNVAKIISDTFIAFCDNDIISITDEIQNALCIKDLRFEDIDVFYDTLDAYTKLREVYTALTYQHDLYINHIIKKQNFINMCSDVLWG